MGLKYKKVEQRLGMGLHEIVKFQIINYCFINDIHLSPNQMETLTFLAELGNMNLTEFCDLISDKEIYKSSQTVRNFILDCVRDEIVIRDETGKTISITEKAELLTEGNIFINMKIYTNGQTKESQESHS